MIKRIFLGTFFFFHLIIWFDGTARAASVKVASTIFSIADMAKQIGGDQIQILTLLPSGANPHTFELPPAAVHALREVQVVFAIGHGFDNWFKPIQENLKHIRVVTVDQNIALLNEDPHYWLSLKNAETIAGTIFLELKGLGLDENKLRRNLDAYLDELRKADREAADRLAGFNGKEIVVVHDAWRYFARDHSLRVLGTLESEHGEPAPKHMAQLTRLVQRHQIKVLFAENRMTRSVAQTFAHDLKLRIFLLDTVEADRGRNYLEAMRENANVISEALSL